MIVLLCLLLAAVPARDRVPQSVVGEWEARSHNGAKLTVVIVEGKGGLVSYWFGPNDELAWVGRWTRTADGWVERYNDGTSPWEWEWDGSSFYGGGWRLRRK